MVEIDVDKIVQEYIMDMDRQGEEGRERKGRSIPSRMGNEDDDTVVIS